MPDADLLFEHFRAACASHPVGVFAPNIDYTYWDFPKERLQRCAGSLYFTPQTDTSCWFVTREVLQRFPGIDPQTSKYGWGIDWVLIALARQIGKYVLRDYAITVSHPQGTGYRSKEAGWEQYRFLMALPRQLRHEVVQLFKEAHAARGTEIRS